jgi:F-type H+-transporting ATPase subunit beta
MVRIRLDFILNILNISLGELDHLPEGAFYMVGGIEDVSARAEKLASER